ncbi:hypothetical protein BC832DRAFT_552712 [Gaertneriomyces semiglobifer]|nr:hypothetical protein BC832DRAFT_552712 [Gaertneriomyces semiglobifer]
MVSFYLLHRGLLYFTISSTNFLPLIKHAMDVYYIKLYAKVYCQKQWLKKTCWDDFGQDWSYGTELGCISIIALITILMLAFHTGLAIYHFISSCRGQHAGFLSGTEFGCCGASAVVLSFATYDEELASEPSGPEAKYRKATRLITALLEVPLLVAVCSAITIVRNYEPWDSGKDSIFLLLVVLGLNMVNLVENVYEGLSVFQKAPEVKKESKKEDAKESKKDDKKAGAKDGKK